MGLIRLEGFDEAVRRNTWTGTKLPTLYKGPRPCTRCTGGNVITLGPYTQHALFRDAGFGHGLKTTIDVCFTCGASRIRTIDAVAPPRGLQRSVA